MEKISSHRKIEGGSCEEKGISSYKGGEHPHTHTQKVVIMDDALSREISFRRRCVLRNSWENFYILFVGFKALSSSHKNINGEIQVVRKF